MLGLPEDYDEPITNALMFCTEPSTYTPPMRHMTPQIALHECNEFVISGNNNTNINTTISVNTNHCQLDFDLRSILHASSQAYVKPTW